MDRRYIIFGLLAVVAVAVTLFVVFAGGDEGDELADDGADQGADYDDEYVDDEIDALFGDDDEWDEDGHLLPSKAQAYGKRGGGPDTTTMASTAESRARRRARRRQRWRERTTIIGLGDTPASIDSDDVFDGFRGVRPILRSCVREAGGWRQFRDQQAGGRPRRSLTFDVGPDGRVQSDTIYLEPEPPSALGDCFDRAVAQMQLPPPGEDGARVEVQLPRRRTMRDGGRPFRRGRPRQTAEPPASDMSPASSWPRPPPLQERE